MFPWVSMDDVVQCETDILVLLAGVCVCVVEEMRSSLCVSDRSTVRGNKQSSAPSCGGCSCVLESQIFSDRSEESFDPT